MISSLITPVRWYNDIYESDRFSTVCDICKFELITDKTRLLPFQFKRPKSGYPVTKWFLRKECEDVANPLLDTNDSLFTLDSGYWDLTQFTISKGKVKAPGNTISHLEKIGIFTVGKYYTIKIVVSDFFIDSLSDFNVFGYYHSTMNFQFTGAGTYSATFLADDTDFIIEGLDGLSTDYIIIESIHISEIQSFSTLIGDIDLPISLLKLVNVGTQDLIMYCGNNLDFQLPCGKYYMIMSSDDEENYYSELITVIDFIPSQSPYTMIEWNNSCDISDVYYQTILGCNYKNRLYIDGELVKNDYPFKEEGEEDGEQNLNITFQKWEKKQSLIVAKAPEFLTDALTTMRLHNTVNITRSLRQKQIQTLPAFEIEKVEADITPIFSDCAFNVELKLLLKDKIVDASCCSNNELPSCIGCDFSVDGLDRLTGNYYFGTIDGDFNLYEITIIQTDALTGFSSGTPLVGYQYLIAGDKTLDYPVGTFIYAGVPTAGNIGIHQVSAVTYDIVNDETAIQWVGIISETVGSPSGSIKKVTYENISVDGITVCDDSNGDMWYNQDGEQWSQPPVISTVVDLDEGGGDHNYTISGFTFPGTFFTVTAIIFDQDTSTTTTINYPTIHQASVLPIDIHSNTFGVPVPDCGKVSFRINSFALNCNYGPSNLYDIWYTECFHPVFQAWYDSLSGPKPSMPIAIDANAFIEGLDADGFLNEFDVLHILAGWETDEQRLKPIISTSGTNFGAQNAPTLNVDGVTGDGAASYVSLQWNAVLSGIKYTQNSAAFGVYISTNVLGDMCDMGYSFAATSVIEADNNFGNFEGGINDGLTSINANGNTVGLFSMVRDSPTSQYAVKDTTPYSANTTASQPLVNEKFYLGARNIFGGEDKFSSRTYQFVYISSHNINITDLYNRLNTYRTSRGL